MIFACIGTHGTGKSTVLDILRNEYGFGSVDGVTRPLIRAGLELSMSPVNYQILVNELTVLQHQPLLYVKDPVVTTRSILDCIAYGRVNFQCSMEFEDKFLEWHKEHMSNYIYMYFPIEFELKEDPERPGNVEYQKKVDDQCRSVLAEACVPFYTISGTVEQRVEQVLNIIKSHTGVTT